VQGVDPEWDEDRGIGRGERGITLATLGMGLIINGWLVGMAVKTEGGGRAKKVREGT